MNNVIEYLINSSKENPNKIVFGDDFKNYSYEEFNIISKKIATKIITSANCQNEPIAVLIDRNVLCLAGFEGILYSGNYYVPIDNKMPITRIINILSQINAKVILYLSSDEELIKELNNSFNFSLMINLDLIKDEEITINEDLIYNSYSKIISVDPCYVIFTSGSTGVPKGVVISHQSVIDFSNWMNTTCKISKEDIMINQAPFYFDLSVKDIYQTIKNGATCYIASKKTLMFPINLIKYINEKRATALIWATSCFNLVAISKVFEKEKLESVNKVILGGEALFGKQLNIWKKANPDIQFINLYGPTEVTVDCTYYIIDKEYNDEDAIPIGKACENKEVLLLNENLEKVKDGEIGEICVRGVGLAKGYFDDIEKTNKSFVQNPYSKYPDLVYKTGDLAFINKDGLITFAQRKDLQIKHMGYRIEMRRDRKSFKFDFKN